MEARERSRLTPPSIPFSPGNLVMCARQQIMSLPLGSLSSCLFAAMLGAAVVDASHHAAAQSASQPLETIIVQSEIDRQGDGNAAANRYIVRSTTDLNAPNGTGSRLPGTARDIPASVESINQATIQQRGKDNWTDALEGLTGITAATRPGAAGIASSRGFTENSFGVLYDGIRVTSATIATRWYDAYVFDRIEVLRGPASVLYGEGAASGAINLVRKQPSRVEQPFETLTSLNSRYGIRQGVGKGGPIGDSFSYRLDAVANRQNGQVDDNVIKYGNITGALRWDLTPRLRSTVDVDYMRSKVDDAYWGTPLVNGRIRDDLRKVNYNNLPNNRYDDDVLWLRWKTEYEPVAGLTLRNLAWAYQANRDWINTYRFAYIPAGAACSFRGSTLINNTVSDKVCRQTWENLGYDHAFKGDRADATWVGNIGPFAASAVVGAEIADTRWDSPRNEVTSLQLVDPHHPPPTDFFTRGTARTQNVLATLGQRSVFGEARVEVLPGVKLVAGGRIDWLDVDYARKPANQLYARQYEPSTYRVGALWDPTRTTTLYASYATAVEPRFALFTLGTTDTPFSLTNSRQYEAGVKQSIDNGRGEIVAAVYHLEKTDIPSTDPLTGGTVQIGKQSSRGIEVAVGWRPSDVVRVDANIAYVDARYDEFRSGTANFAGNLPPNVPATVGNLGLAFLPWEGWTLGGWLHYRTAIMADDANRVKLPDALTIDAYATHRFNKNADLTFRIRNLTDRVYAAWATDANYVILAMPRTFELALRTTF
jgi:iron complex outermembrane recepter protein